MAIMTADQATALNLAATFLPQVAPCTPWGRDGDIHNTPCTCYGLPCVEIGGVQVYVYADAERGLRIAVHLEEAEAPLLVNDRMVPLEFDITGEVPVYRIDADGREEFALRAATR